jgi:hypothetical protein
MSIQALTNKSEYIELEDLPSFCVIRPDLLNDGEGVPVGDHYIYKDKIYLYAWDIDENFYIFVGGLANEASGIDFEFPLLELLREDKREIVA